MSKQPILIACAFVWGMVAGVSLAIVSAGNAQEEVVATSTDGVGTLYIDGVPCGTFTGALYELETGDFFFQTTAGAPDCGPSDRIFSDRFET